MNDAREERWDEAGNRYNCLLVSGSFCLKSYLKKCGTELRYFICGYNSLFLLCPSCGLPEGGRLLYSWFSNRQVLSSAKESVQLSFFCSDAYIVEA